MFLLKPGSTINAGRSTEGADAKRNLNGFCETCLPADGLSVDRQPGPPVARLPVGRGLSKTNRIQPIRLGMNNREWEMNCVKLRRAEV